jgi:hypothetical protein
MLVVIALLVWFVGAVIADAEAPRRTGDAPSRPYLPYHHNTSNAERNEENPMAKKTNYYRTTNDVADDVVSCGSCCYKIVAARSPLESDVFIPK